MQETPYSNLRIKYQLNDEEDIFLRYILVLGCCSADEFMFEKQSKKT